MASFDYDAVVIGSGFGGHVAALRAAEKGYRVGVMESGKRWKDEDIPKSQWHLPDFLWFPAAELYGIQRVQYLDDVLVLSGADVGGVACAADARPEAWAAASPAVPFNTARRVVPIGSLLEKKTLPCPSRITDSWPTCRPNGGQNDSVPLNTTMSTSYSKGCPTAQLRRGCEATAPWD
jgi:choline dehydrogenase-like flavoprotein